MKTLTLLGYTDYVLCLAAYNDLGSSLKKRRKFSKTASRSEKEGKERKGYEKNETRYVDSVSSYSLLLSSD